MVGTEKETKNFKGEITPMFSNHSMSRIARNASLMVASLSLCGLVLGASRRGDDHGRGHKSDNVISIQYGSPFPSGSGTSTVRTDGLGKNDDNGRRHNSDNVITIQYGSPFPSGSGTTTVRTDGMTSGPAAGFLKSLNRSSANSGSSEASTPAAARLAPFAGSSGALGRGRASMSVSVDGDSGLQANAGWTWTLR